jgi:hypothetical protein
MLPPGAEAIDLGQAVLACFLLEGVATVRAHPIRPTAFFTEAQRAIYDTMVTLAEQGDPVDALTVIDTLRRADQLDAIGGAAALAALVENPLAACVPASLPDYIRRLGEYGARRDAITRSLELASHLQNGHCLGDLLAEVETLAVDLRSIEARPLVPTMTTNGDTICVAWPALDVLITLDRVRDASEGPHADVRISRRGERLHLARLSLLSSHQREGVAKALARKAPVLPWRDLMETAADLVVMELRRGAPIVEVIPRPRDPARVLLRVPAGNFFVAGEPALGFADVGTGKGYLAMAGALAMMTGDVVGPFHPTRGGLRVGYLDWEATEAEIAGRQDALGRGHDLTLPPGLFFYRKMSRPLSEEGPAIRAMVARHQLDVLIVDSAGPAARASDPGDTDAIFRVFETLRDQGATPLILGHIAKGSIDSARATPYGSTFWRALARDLFELRRSTEGDDPAVLTIALRHDKRNFGPRLREFGMRFTFAPDDAVTVTSLDLRESPDLLRHGALPPRILEASKRGAATSKELSDRLDVGYDTVDRTARRLRKQGDIIALPETRPIQWALPS